MIDKYAVINNKLKIAGSDARLQKQDIWSSSEFNEYQAYISDFGVFNYPIHVRKYDTYGSSGRNSLGYKNSYSNVHVWPLINY